MKKSLIALIVASGLGAAHAQTIDMGPLMAAQPPTAVAPAAPANAAAPAPAATPVSVAASSPAAPNAPALSNATPSQGPMTPEQLMASMTTMTPPSTEVLVPPPTHSNSKEINPFNGKALTLEQTQRALEESKLRTQQLEETLKQSNLQKELASVPNRQAAEVAQMATAIAKERSNYLSIMAPVSPPVTVKPEPAPEPKPKPKPKTVKPKTETKPASTAQAAQPMPRPTLVSIVSVGTRRSAILEVSGATMAVADGDMTPFGPLRILNNRAVSLGGNKVEVHSATMARFVVSDPVPVDPRQQSNNRSGMSSGVGPAAIPPAVAQPAALPPLQLPPGVAVKSGS